MASAQQYKYPGVEGRKPSATVARKIGAELNEAMGFIMEVTPGAGSYSTQANFLLEDWQDAQWGSNYPKLLRIKRRYDPANFFRVHHGVEAMSARRFSSSVQVLDEERESALPGLLRD